MKKWYNYSWNEVVRKLNTDNKYGLPLEKIEEYRQKFGDNKTLEFKSKSFIVLFFMEIIKLYNFLGIILSVALFYLGDLKKGIFFSTLILISVILYSIKNYKNQSRLNNLKIITPIKADVIRSGKMYTINPDELVVGDVVYVESGDIVPADLRILECENLKIKESAITGNNDIIEKYSTKIEDKEILPSEMGNIAFKSSFVIEGDGKGVVIACGEKTEIGSINNDLIKESYQRSILEENISKILTFLSLFFIGYSVIISIFAFFEKINFAIIHKVLSFGYLTIVPIHIILLIFLIEFITIKYLEKKGIVVGGVSSLQMLSSTNVLFMNKIGSLTENKMYVRKMFSNGKMLTTYSGDVEDNKDNIDRMISIGILCNDAQFDIEGNIFKGDILDRAIIQYAKQNDINKKSFDLKQERILKIPFDVDKKIKTTVNKIENKYRGNTIGAVDKLLDRCTHIMKNGIELEITPKDIIDIKSADLKMSKEGLYVLGFAYRNFNYEPSLNENIESNLVFVGLTGFENPLKIDYEEYIRHCRALAIKPVIITDDNKITANAFGEKVKIINKNDIVLSGVEIDNMEDGELEKFVEKVGVYSKISSKNKFNICSYFKKIGYKVAVTGKRFTDLPSFRRSHIGIAVGDKCTKITKKISDIFIEDNDFNGILELIENSRKLSKVIKNIIEYNFVIVAVEFSAIILLSFLGNIGDLKFYQILILNFINLVVSSIIIYTQYKYTDYNRYESVEINKNIFNEIDLSVILYIVVVAISICKVFTMKLHKSIILGNSVFFIMLSGSLILFLFYYVDITSIVKDKISSLILFLNIVFNIVVFYYTVSNIDCSLKELFYNFKFVWIFLIVQIFVVNFLKEIKSNIK